MIKYTKNRLGELSTQIALGIIAVVLFVPVVWVELSLLTLAGMLIVFPDVPVATKIRQKVNFWLL